MSNKFSFAVSITADECGFLLDFCESQLKLDLALKLTMAKMSPKEQLILLFSVAELKQLVTLLTQKAKASESMAVKVWAEELAIRFSETYEEPVFLQ